MKALELRKKSEKELKELLATERSVLASVHFKTAKSRAKDVKSEAHMKRNIARILTVLKEQHE